MSVTQDNPQGNPPKTRRRAAIEAVILAIAVALVIAHTVYWHVNGEQTRLYEEHNALTVLYDMVLILGTGVLLGLLLMRVTEAMGYEVSGIEHFSDDEETLEEAPSRHVVS